MVSEGGDEVGRWVSCGRVGVGAVTEGGDAVGGL